MAGRSTVFGAAAAGVLMLLSGFSAPALAAEAAAPASTVGWKPCADAPGLDCGTVTVPIDWSKPHGATIEIALARKKATDPGARIGSILMDPGGPGGSGVDEVKAGWSLSPEITRRFDTVGFDPRGVGASHPVLCDYDKMSAPYAQVPANEAEFRGLAAHNKALGESCRKLTGPLFDFVDTESVARDMDVIRAGLGERKLTYYGESYGTLMGQQYAELFPENIRALVLDSNMDHSQTTAWQFLRSESKSAQGLFEQFAAWCDRTASCALHGQDVGAVFADLYGKSERGELKAPGSGEPIEPSVLLGTMGGAFYGPSWGQLASYLASLRDGKPNPESFGAAEPSAISVPSPFQAVFCQDWSLPVRSFAELDVYRKAIERTVAPDMKRSPLGWTATTGCIGWPGQVRNPPHPLSVHGAPPVLMLNSRYDPATPYEWARTASRQSGAVLLSYDGWGHGAYFKNSDCVIQATDDYLITGKTPRRGTHCAAVEPGPASAQKNAPRTTGPAQRQTWPASPAFTAP
ncbi:alpha/beta hydrolase [Amycolatopsis sp. H20-H5]|uniref:alpha/beta hydrolase n=1 Tax=Amycolatopsis sp. H20-H5 TaxID=3046309 RepID=UPI002DB88F18|nr:alpha/beta hydrolase [Amycolatopsis sp. H20-H5]MEC3979322.1 alpha/beta hydrolase [Amycolatopsis sp. H20-H5]